MKEKEMETSIKICENDIDDIGISTETEKCIRLEKKAKRKDSG